MWNWLKEWNLTCSRHNFDLSASLNLLWISQMINSGKPPKKDDENENDEDDEDDDVDVIQWMSKCMCKWIGTTG